MEQLLYIARLLVTFVLSNCNFWNGSSRWHTVTVSRHQHDLHSSPPPPLPSWSTVLRQLIVTRLNKRFFSTLYNPAACSLNLTTVQSHPVHGLTRGVFCINFLPCVSTWRYNGARLSLICLQSVFITRVISTCPDRSIVLELTILKTSYWFP